MHVLPDVLKLQLCIRQLRILPRHPCLQSLDLEISCLQSLLYLLVSFLNLTGSSICKSSGRLQHKDDMLSTCIHGGHDPTLLQLFCWQLEHCDADKRIMMIT